MRASRPTNSALLTFGRQNSLMADDLLKYDPQLQSQAFSPIGYAGTSGGLGDTEDKALDDMIKYTYAVWSGADSRCCISLVNAELFRKGPSRSI